MTRILSKRENIILYIAVGVFSSMLSFNFLIKPILIKNAILNKEIRSLQMKLSKYAQLLSQKELIQEKYSKFVAPPKGSQEQGDASLVSFSELEKIAQNADIKILDIRPQRVSGGRNYYKETLIDLRTIGEVEGYLKFLYDLENSLSLFKIQKFQLTAKPAALEGRFSISQLSLP